MERTRLSLWTGVSLDSVSQYTFAQRGIRQWPSLGFPGFRFGRLGTAQRGWTQGAVVGKP